MAKEKKGQEQIHRFVIMWPENDPRSRGTLSDAHDLGLRSITRIEAQDLYYLKGSLTKAELEKLSTYLLYDVVTQQLGYEIFDAGSLAQSDLQPDQFVVEVMLRSGVTDPVAEQIVRASKVIGIDGISAAATGTRYVVTASAIGEKERNILVQQLLANPVIQHYSFDKIIPSFPVGAKQSDKVERFDIAGYSDEQLLALSDERRAALNLEEMRAIRDYCRAQAHTLTDVEFEMIAQTWSEHCVHKTFKALITTSDGKQVNNLFKTYIRAATEKVNAPWVRSAFVDNAGIIDFDDEYELSFKAETHNHPSAIEPFGGANTGVGGVIRDVLGVSAKPIAATDVLCFGPQDTSFDDLPAGVLHPRRIASGVISGVQDYGNKIGLPTVSGGVLYDEGYISNPLVYCGCVGIAPKGSHPREPKAGDHIIVLGGGTGRDGLRGATFSSMTMDATTGEVSGASVQIGAPVIEKGLIDVIIKARDARLYSAVTDCGAGGLSSAVGEMSSEIGAKVDLEKVRLKYPGLTPWEIWLSEAQERMVLAVPANKVKKLQAICDLYDVSLTDIGTFTASGKLVINFNGKKVLELDNQFLHHGLPQRKLKATLPKPIKAQKASSLPKVNYSATLKKLLSHPNIASKEKVIRLYDHEIMGATIQKPLTGAEATGPADAAVLKPVYGKTERAFALGVGINPEYGKFDSYNMAFAVIDEAVRNVVAVGADPAQIAILDNFCWGDPLNEETMGTLLTAARGCHDAAVFYGTPFISGKDSLNNEYYGKDGRKHAIPPSLLISSLGILPNYQHMISMDLKHDDSVLYLAGLSDFTFGGSHYNLIAGKNQRVQNEPVPIPHKETARFYGKLYGAICDGLVASAHDLSEGGLAVAAAEMCIAGGLGMHLTLAGEPLRVLFGETAGCLLVEVPADAQKAFETRLGKKYFTRIGESLAKKKLIIDGEQGEPLLSANVDQLEIAWRGKTSQKAG